MSKTETPRRRELLRILEEVQYSKAERRRCQERLETLREECRRVTACFSAVPVAEHDPGRREALLAELMDQETEICRRIGCYWAAVRRAEDLIDAVPDPKSRALLRLRYVDGLRWPAVTKGLTEYGFFYEERQVYRLHNAALEAAEELLSRTA